MIAHFICAHISHCFISYNLRRLSYCRYVSALFLRRSFDNIKLHSFGTCWPNINRSCFHCSFYYMVSNGNGIVISWFADSETNCHMNTSHVQSPTLFLPCHAKLVTLQFFVWLIFRMLCWNVLHRRNTIYWILYLV